MEKLSLAFGYGAAVPPGAPAAWGARTIPHGSSLDVLGDRISIDSVSDEAKARLIDKLKAVGPVALAEAKLAEGLRPSDDPVDIYEDVDFRVVGRLFGGYFYLAAYLKPAEPGIVLPRKATEPSGPIWLKLIRAVLDSEDKDVFKLLDVGPGEDGVYREAYAGADIVFPGYDESIVRVVPKSEAAESVIRQALAELEVSV